MSGASPSDRKVGDPRAADVGHETTLDVGRGVAPAATGPSPGALRPGDTLGRFAVRANAARPATRAVV